MGIVAAGAEIIPEIECFIRAIAISGTDFGQRKKFVEFPGSDVKTGRPADKNVVVVKNFAHSGIHGTAFAAVGVAGEFLCQRCGGAEQGKGDDSGGVKFHIFAMK